MILLPRLLGLILCEQVAVDPATGRFSLVGLFHARRYSEYPTPSVAFTAYAALFDGVGEGTLKLAVNQLETGVDVYTYQRWMVFPGRMLTVHMEIKVTRCVFPAPGDYDVFLSFDGQELARRRLFLHQA
jgi:hypothetical protein